MIYFSLTGENGEKLRINVGTFTTKESDFINEKFKDVEMFGRTLKVAVSPSNILIDGATVYNSGTELNRRYSADYLAATRWLFDNDNNFSLVFKKSTSSSMTDTQTKIISRGYFDNESIPWDKQNYTIIRAKETVTLRPFLYVLDDDGRWVQLMQYFMFTGFSYYNYEIVDSFGGESFKNGQPLINLGFSDERGNKLLRGESSLLTAANTFPGYCSIIFDSSTGFFNTSWSGHTAKIIGLPERSFPQKIDKSAIDGAVVAVSESPSTPDNFYSPYIVPKVPLLSSGEVIPPFEYSVTIGGATSASDYVGKSLVLFGGGINAEVNSSIYTGCYFCVNMYEADITKQTPLLRKRMGLNSDTPIDRNTLLYYLLFEKQPETDFPPYPDIDPDPDKPPVSGGGDEPTYTPPYGGDGDGDNESELVPIPQLPSTNIVKLGLINLYDLTQVELRSFAYYLWHDFDFTRVKEFFSNPVEAIISLSLFPMIFSSAAQRTTIALGNVQTPCSASIIDNNFMSLDFGTITIPEYYGDYSDYGDTRAEIYLPFIGRYSLNIYEVMNSSLHLIYNVDVLSGNATAILYADRDAWGTRYQSVIAEYSGIVNQQLPLSSLDNSSLVSSFIGLAQGQLTLPKETQKTLSSVTASNGMLGSKIAYINIERPIHYVAATYGHNHGFPYESTMTLGMAKGFTIVREIFLNGQVIGSNEETIEIVNLLSEGVIL